MTANSQWECTNYASKAEYSTGASLDAKILADAICILHMDKIEKFASVF